ncbi:thiamine pyrophosphate-binding protein [Thalassotalea sp. 1_MG-2023]|uniref:thiamine pyrophosphate-binding protein n=1 Tax=Thalassotalea sp. 1_MG-2023 TaxID=3062680 RepID=UPI0026E1E784|nr:thiamine pyrophosphate-binding protein [Thalassotalea sp. 1_MG-2023]MDO6428682.1 thiamine pyrophosphate-binding protein [Thalassotalea sp. 1_MG-2023]
MTVSEYIIKKLKAYGCNHVAGIPGTSCAGFFNAIDRDKDINYILTTNELESGYIADGYGRNGGFGAVCVSYGVGTLSLLNAVASAFTERVPLLVINGGPTEKDLQIESEFGSLFSHSTGAKQTDLNVFKHVTVFAEVIENVSEAKTIIDKAFDTADKEFRPVYIEVPQDYWDNEIPEGKEVTTSQKIEVNTAFQTLANTTILNASSPVLIIGVEVVRRNLYVKVLALIEKWNIPFVTTALSKSYILESHPLFVGCYDSDLFHSSDRFEIIDKSDCSIGLGCIWGIDHRAFVTTKFNDIVEMSFSKGRVSKEKFESVDLELVIDAFLELDISVTTQIPEKPARSLNTHSDYFGHEQVFASINEHIQDQNNIQIATDTCLGSFLGADLDMPSRNMYLANPVWLSIGQGTPAAIGAYLKNKKTPIIISGDGGFQMVAQSFSTMVKYKIPALIIILDNSLYAIEQYLIDNSYFTENKAPLKYVKLNNWSYENFPNVFNGGIGKRAKTKLQFDEIISSWVASEKNEPWIVACEIPHKDLPPN